MKRISLFSAYLLIILFFTEKSFTQQLSIEIPVCAASEFSCQNKDTELEDHEIHAYTGFTLCYRESYELSEWVAYILTREELNKVTGRPKKYYTDYNISTMSAEPSDYSRSGYDRGHLAPAADMEWSKQSAKESSYMSNIAPQISQLNQGLWNELEQKVRKWAETFGEIAVITGPILEKDPSEYKKIGKNNISVPEYYYKVLLAPQKTEDGKGTFIALAFIMPNQNCTGSVFDYAATIDEIETRTGLNFFSLIPDKLENELEKNIDFSGWILEE
ncbi:MAG: DNA/RNA non-specific endonuclease [Treponema sp.]|nr:DNA/RNA non-specific endonuclease [Treponema sp.]